MTDEPKKRPWFQFHLSTAIVLMFVVAGLIWLNAIPIDEDMPHSTGRLHGWPWSAWTYPFGSQIEGHVGFLRPKCLYADLFVAVSCFLTVAVVCEFWIRRPPNHYRSTGLLVLVLTAGLVLLETEEVIRIQRIGYALCVYGWPARYSGGLLFAARNGGRPAAVIAVLHYWALLLDLAFWAGAIFICAIAYERLLKLLRVPMR